MMNTCKGRCQRCSFVLDMNLDGEKIERRDGIGLTYSH